MKRLLGFSLLSLSVAIGLFATNWGQRPAGRSPVAEAAADSISIVSQQCLSSTDVRVVFAWSVRNEGPQWVDLSLSNNGFFPGTFVGLGPIPSNQTTFTWDGILAGLTHYLRVNTLTPAGWSTSPTITFTTRGDCQFTSQVPLGVGATNVVLNQTCLANGTPRVTVTWTPSGQGQQWMDYSAYSSNFEPGTFPSVGPFANNQNIFLWDGLAPGSFQFVRINTGTPFGWIGSVASPLFIRMDCVAPATPTPTPTVVAQPTATATATAVATATN